MQVLCAAASACNKLPEEEVRPHQPAAHQEEDQVITCCFTRCAREWVRALPVCTSVSCVSNKFLLRRLLTAIFPSHLNPDILLQQRNMSLVGYAQKSTSHAVSCFHNAGQVGTLSIDLAVL